MINLSSPLSIKRQNSEGLGTSVSSVSISSKEETRVMISGTWDWALCRAHGAGPGAFLGVSHPLPLPFLSLLLLSLSLFQDKNKNKKNRNKNSTPPLSKQLMLYLIKTEKVSSISEVLKFYWIHTFFGFLDPNPIYMCWRGFPIPTSNSQMPAACRRIQLSSDIIYLEIPCYPIGEGFRPTRLHLLPLQILVASP